MFGGTGGQGGEGGTFSERGGTGGEAGDGTGGNSGSASGGMTNDGFYPDVEPTSGTVFSCGSPPCSLQSLIDDAPDGSLIEIGPDPFLANVTVVGKRLALKCDTGGVPTEWSCLDDNERAITVGAGADLTIDGCVFQGCGNPGDEDRNSGVLLLQGANRLIVRRCIFRNNRAYRGAVLSNWNDSADQPMATNAFVLLEDNILYSNFGTDAAAIYLRGELTLQIANNLIYYNNAQSFAGAVWLREQVRSRLFFAKNVVYQNISTQGAALEATEGQGALINSSILLDNITASGDYSDGWDTVFTQVGGADPFVDPVDGDFRLTEQASAKDAGDPALPLDSDGSRTDQGAYNERLPVEPL